MLEVENITAGYSGVPVLKGVSISVGEGEFVSIVGPNGAGKTTLFKTISGTLTPMAGSIRFEQSDLLSTPPARRPHLGIAHVPEGRQVFPSLTVMDNLELGAYTEAGRRDWSRNIERILAWLPVLAERRNQLAGTLSGGEQQMLAMARALCLEPQVLLLDEPTEGLMPSMIARIREVVAALRGRGVSTVLVEQRVDAVLAVADRVCFIENGQNRETVPVETVRADPDFVHRYVGVS